MKHQLEALRRSEGQEYFAYLMEQGTGKTWTVMADAERAYAAGQIDALLVVAPKGVHTNWARREIPEHMSVQTMVRVWRSGMGKWERDCIDDLLRPRKHGQVPPLRVLCMNIDSINTKEGFEFVKKFLRSTKAMWALDESSRIKNPESKRTIRILRLRPLAALARIMSGTPITKAPMDIFSQFEFMESGLLGTTSYRSFTAEYAELSDPKTDPALANMIRRNPRIAKAQIVARNEDGTPKWRNLDKLQKLIAPHAFRVLKKDCLELPDKIYKTVFFRLEAAQQKAYKLMKERLRIKLDDGSIDTVQALAGLVKLQQITSGYVVRPDEQGMIFVGDDNPRLDLLMETLEDIEGKAIIWARFRPELEMIGAALKKAGYKHVEYHGAVSAKDREHAIDNFQKGDSQFFLGQQQSGGIGLTLTAATTVIYFSNSFDYEVRAQSEDRAHRIGTKENVVYIDLVAEDTIDEPIARSLQRKAGMAAAILDEQGLRLPGDDWADNDMGILAAGEIQEDDGYDPWEASAIDFSGDAGKGHGAVVRRTR